MATLSESPAASKATVPGVTYQDPRFCSKEKAPSNISDISVTAETSHPETSWLKERAL